MSKKLKKVPLGARNMGVSVCGTLVLILWQREFAWPSWVYGAIWTLWGIVLLAQIVGAIVLALDDDGFVSDEDWQRVFK